MDITGIAVTLATAVISATAATGIRGVIGTTGIIGTPADIGTLGFTAIAPPGDRGAASRFALPGSALATGGNPAAFSLLQNGTGFAEFPASMRGG